MEFNKETFCTVGAGCGIFSAISIVAYGIYSGAKMLSAKKAEKEIEVAKKMAAEQE